MSTAAAPAARCSFCSLDLDTLRRPGRTQPDFWDGGNQHFSETAEGRKSAATANVKINKWFGNQPFFWCLVQPRHPIISNTIVDLSYTSFKEAASKIFICSIAIETSCAALTHSSFRLKRDRQRKKTCPRLKTHVGRLRIFSSLSYTCSFALLCWIWNQNNRPVSSEWHPRWQLYCIIN